MPVRQHVAAATRNNTQHHATTTAQRHESAENQNKAKAWGGEGVGVRAVGVRGQYLTGCNVAMGATNKTKETGVKQCLKVDRVKSSPKIK